MCDIRYFKAARHNYDYAEKTKIFYASDEAYVNDIAYNLEQCVEKTLKAFLECVGVTIPNTHSISKLIRMSENNGSAVKITEWLKLHAFELESWEAETRYNFDFSIQKQNIDEAFIEIEKFLVINGLSERLLNGLDKDEIRRVLPQNIEPNNNFEWNCYYNILLRKKHLKVSDIFK